MRLVRPVFSNSDTSLLSEPSSGVLVKLKLVARRWFSERAPRRAPLALRYRDCPVVEIAQDEYKFTSDLSARSGEYVCLVQSELARSSRPLSKLRKPDCLDPGQVKLCGYDLASLSRSRRRSLLARVTGTVSPDLPLAPELSVKENVSLPLLLAGSGRRAAEAAAQRALAELSLRPLADELPAALTALEYQFAELARAVAGDIQLLLLEDFPRGLDPRERTLLIAAVWRVARARGIAVLHNTTALEAVAYCDVVRSVGPSPPSVFSR